MKPCNTLRLSPRRRSGVHNCGENTQTIPQTTALGRRPQEAQRQLPRPLHRALLSWPHFSVHPLGEATCAWLFSNGATLRFPRSKLHRFGRVGVIPHAPDSSLTALCGWKFPHPQRKTLLKSHRGCRVRRKRQRLPSNGPIESARRSASLHTRTLSRRALPIEFYRFWPTNGLPKSSSGRTTTREVTESFKPLDPAGRLGPSSFYIPR
jgi:hypothetical protein